MLDRLLDIWWKLYDWIVGAVLVGMIVAIVAVLLRWIYEQLKASLRGQ